MKETNRKSCNIRFNRQLTETFVHAINAKTSTLTTTQKQQLDSICLIDI